MFISYQWDASTPPELSVPAMWKSMSKIMKIQVTPRLGTIVR